MTKKQRQVNLLLDSGAFSAWSRGEQIDVKDYIRYLKENEDLLWHYVGLDKIPGEFGMRYGTQDEVEESAKQTYENQRAMRKAGLKPIPVFHMGERLYWLKKYLDDGEEYIGISASKFVRIEEQMRWLDSIFNMITDSKGHPYIKTHGFALTAFPLISNYPWYSVDSTTWSLTPGYGQIIIPHYDRVKDEFDFRKTPTRVAISGVTHQSPSSQAKQTEQYTSLSGNSEYMAIVNRWLRECGVTIEQIRYGTQYRRRAMLIYYLKLCEALRGVTFNGRRGMVWGPDQIDMSGRKAVPPFNLILTFATSLNREWAVLMNEVGANHRLISYYELRERGRDILELYVTTGNHGEYKPKPLGNDYDSETYINKRKLRLYDRLENWYARQEEDGFGETDPRVVSPAREVASETQSKGSAKRVRL